MPITARPVGKSILFAIITLGIYCIFWTYQTHKELQRSNGGHGVGGALGAVIFFFVSPATFFLVPSEIDQAYVRIGRPSPVRVINGLWVLLPLVGPFIWYPKMQHALNDLSGQSAN